MPFESFDQKIDSLEGAVPSILLGNGFSQSWDAAIFNYKNLLASANFGPRDVAIRHIFSIFDTFDFEKIMLSLDSAKRICEIYRPQLNLVDEFEQDKNQLKNSLINVISDTHPARSSRVSIPQYSIAKPFISQFDKVFTLNYDLLLYWIINKSEVHPLGYNHSDGFMGTTWIAREEQSIFFLHGGLHLYDTGTSIHKIAFNGNLNESISEQVRTNLNNGNFPLFVSEPTADKKLERIKHNPYLNSCYLSLKKLSGNLFIHGHSIDENDRHIFDKIKESNVEKIFVGIYGDENSHSNLRSIANANAFLSSRNIVIEFYDSSTAPIWQ
ncbi:DUF4917 family protein [Rouxiella sp. S1S-2]|uniref:DUF4917 family protein n=1 Tax=Rouxiella sp. S1S-2 TaxID=2653856 RepID=UPI0012659FEA|nr:DUF4917 family protein [Rouxiella sp. S1S-2]KAB7895999.1 DUF4917 family protein [Rouxiella sp. S1S-2]